MWGAHFQQSSQIQFQTQETCSNWRFHENFDGKWSTKWELCNLTNIFNNILSTAVEKWEICVKKEEKGKKEWKKIRQITLVGAWIARLPYPEEMRWIPAAKKAIMT